jgi:cytochrome b561
VTPPRVRYSGLQQLLHWLTVLLTAAALPIAWVMTASPDSRPGTEDLYNVHKTLGLLILGAVVFRLILRAFERAPPLPAHVAGLERTLVEATHGLLYVVFLAMALSGWLDVAASRYPTLFLDVFPLPQLPQDPELHRAAKRVHRLVQWAIYTLVSLHVAAVVVHTAFKRDGLLGRMLPEQTRD